jgi:hypothetical protein
MSRAFAFIVSLVAGFCLSPATAQTPALKREAYEAWAVHYRNDVPRWYLPTEIPEKVKLAVTAIDGEELDYVNRIHEKAVRYYYLVSVRGASTSFRVVPDLAVEGGGLDKDLLDLKQIDELIYALPDDHSILPPANRRLVIQVPRTVGVEVRVYDRSHLPSEVVKILRILGVAQPPFLLPSAQP